jgi:surface polysaccharide O-acyltransferase-like enzyme
MRANLEQRTVLGWIDGLRIFACFLVVFSHCCDGFVAEFDNDRSSFLTGVFLGSLVRPCVPLFVMMTGVLLLPINSSLSLSSFYKKRIGRLFWPFVFWSLCLPLLFYVYFTGWGVGSVNPAIPMESYTLDGLLNRWVTFPINFNYDTTPLWYLYMLVGLYLLIPILNAWLLQATKKDLLLVLKLWGGSLLLPYLKMIFPILGYVGNYGNLDILGGCDWNVYSSLYYISGFIGYLILAYYLMRYPIVWSWRKLCVIGIPVFLVGYLVTSFGYIILQNYFPGNYAYLEIIWLFCGLNVFMMTFPLFLIFQKIKFKNRSWVRTLASCTFGIYLSHFFWVAVFYDLFNISLLPDVLRIFLMAFTTFVVSFFIVYVMSKNDFTKRFIA